MVDDGSPDNCPQICDRYANENACVKVVHKPNGGLSSARNCGIREATGKYIMFLDSDDWWDEKAKLEAIIRKIEESGDVQMTCFPSLEYIPDNGLSMRKDNSFFEEKEGVWNKEQYYQIAVESGNLQEAAYTKVFDRQFLVQNELYFQEGILGEDTEWMFRVLRVISKVLVLNIPLIIYRNGREGSITNNVTIKNVLDLLGTISQSVDYYQEQEESLLKKCELAQCAYLWFISLSMLSKLPSSDRKKCEKTIREYSYLTEYAHSGKVKMARIVLRILRVRVTAYLLNVYVELGKRNIVSKRKKIKNAE